MILGLKFSKCSIVNNEFGIAMNTQSLRYQATQQEMGIHNNMPPEHQSEQQLQGEPRLASELLELTNTVVPPAQFSQTIDVATSSSVPTISPPLTRNSVLPDQPQLQNAAFRGVPS